MKRSVEISILAVVFALCIFARATTVIRLSVEDLARRSSHVVDAQAVNSWSTWNAQRTLIYTYTRFDVKESLQGPGVKSVTVKQIGGSAEGYTQRVAGVRRWSNGERAVLFLRPSESFDGTLEVTGLVQGDFRVFRSGMQSYLSNGVTGVFAYDPNSRRTSEFQGSRITFGELKSRVRQAVQP